MLDELNKIITKSFIVLLSKQSDWFKKIGISFFWKKLDLVSNPSNHKTVIFSILDLRTAQKTTIILLFTPFWSKLVWFGKNQKPKLKSDFRLFMYTTTIGAIHNLHFKKNIVVSALKNCKISLLVFLTQNIHYIVYIVYCSSGDTSLRDFYMMSHY